MDHATKSCMSIIQNAIDGVRNEKSNIERENEKLRAALLFAIGHCTATYFLTDEADVAGDLLDIDPLTILTKRYEEEL